MNGKYLIKRIFIFIFHVTKERSYHNVSASCDNHIVKQLKELEFKSFEDAKRACDNINEINQSCNVIEGPQGTKCGEKPWRSPKYKLCQTTSRISTGSPWQCMFIAGEGNID